MNIFSHLSHVIILQQCEESGVTGTVTGYSSIKNVCDDWSVSKYKYDDWYKIFVFTTSVLASAPSASWSSSPCLTYSPPLLVQEEERIHYGPTLAWCEPALVPPPTW